MVLIKKDSMPHKSFNIEDYVHLRYGYGFPSGLEQIIDWTAD